LAPLGNGVKPLELRRNPFRLYLSGWKSNFPARWEAFCPFGNRRSWKNQEWVFRHDLFILPVSIWIPLSEPFLPLGQAVFCDFLWIRLRLAQRDSPEHIAPEILDLSKTQTLQTLGYAAEQDAK